MAAIDGINQVHHVNFLHNTLPAASAQLIIADPPYHETKGDFDFIWRSFDHYLSDVEQWADEVYRLLSPTGTLFWYGPAKKIAYSQIILDRLFGEPISCPVWEKTDCQTRKGIDDYRVPAPVTERLLMYTKEKFNLTGCISVIRDYIRSEIILATGSVNYKDINTALGTATTGGGIASACLSLQKDEPAMLTEEMYLKLRNWLNSDYSNRILYLTIDYSDLRKKYDDLRLDYEQQRRPFNNLLKLTDVFKFSQETMISGKYDHETQKPEKLTRALIITCSRPGDMVIVPFAGSGTECSMAAKEKRNFIAFDIDIKHVNTANKRAGVNLSQPHLF